MLSIALTCLLIVVARVVDVSLGTIRMINVVHGRRCLALVLGFVEILIWVFIVSRVIHEIHQPAYAIAYALGFALGNYVGMTIEHKLALGRQVVCIITRHGYELAGALRETGLRVTQFDGMGRDGPVQEIFVEVGRRSTGEVIDQARKLDSSCYYMVDDVRRASSTEVKASRSTGRWGFLKR